MFARLCEQTRHLSARALGTATSYVLPQLSSSDVRYSYRVTGMQIALTIDDAPSENTPRILDLLARHGIRATFFAIGVNAVQHPAMVKRIRAEGHELANHDLLDRVSVWVNESTFETDLLATEELLELSGRKFFRPGSGLYSARLLRQLKMHGYSCVLGDVYPFDPQIPSSQFATSYIQQQTAPGSIIILHDGDQKGMIGSSRGERTLEVLSAAIPDLLARGFTFHTLSEMEALETRR